MEYDSTWSVNQIGSLDLKLYYMTMLLGQDSLIAKETKEEKLKLISEFLFRYNDLLVREQTVCFPCIWGAHFLRPHEWCI